MATFDFGKYLKTLSTNYDLGKYIKTLIIIMDFVENINYGVAMKQFENRFLRMILFMKFAPLKIIFVNG